MFTLCTVVFFDGNFLKCTLQVTILAFSRIFLLSKIALSLKKNGMTWKLKDSQTSSCSLQRECSLLSVRGHEPIHELYGLQLIHGHYAQILGWNKSTGNSLANLQSILISNVLVTLIPFLKHVQIDTVTSLSMCTYWPNVTWVNVGMKSLCVL